MKKNNRKVIIFILALFAIAMAFVEASVVIYLRELYYPSGFLINSVNDLVALPSQILNVEILREASTIVMIAAVAYLAFPKTKEKLLSFLWIFALWDLFYYFFLYVFLGWPPSLATLDVYFLIPWPWVGPVWFPIALFSIVAVFSFWFLVREKD